VPFFPEHLDWHGSSDQYFDDKLSLVAAGPRVVIANGDDDMLRTELTKRYPALTVEWVGVGHSWHLEPEGKHSWLCHGSQRSFYTEDSPSLGVHNHRNMLLALAGAHATGALNADVIGSVLSAFSGLGSRLEKIPDSSGLVFVNDSLATNPHAAVAGLQACSSPGMVWLVGGYDRGSGLSAPGRSGSSLQAPPYSWVTGVWGKTGWHVPRGAQSPGNSRGRSP